MAMETSMRAHTVGIGRVVTKPMSRFSNSAGSRSQNVYCVIELRYDGSLLVSSIDKRIKRWSSTPPHECLQVYEGHKDSVRSLAELDDCERFVSGSYDGTIRVWSIASGKCLQVLFECDSRCFILLRHVSLYKVSNGSRSSSIINKKTEVLVSCSPIEGDISLWDLKSERCSQKLYGHSKPVLSLCEMKNGNIASASKDGTIRVWNPFNSAASKGDRQRSCVQCLMGHTKEVELVSELKGRDYDGVLVSSSSMEGTMKLWNSSEGVCLKTIHVDQICCIVAVNSSIGGGKGLFLTSGFDKCVRGWNNRGDLLFCESLPSAFRSICQKRNGDTTTIVSGLDNGDVEFWSLEMKLSMLCCFEVVKHYTREELKKVVPEDVYQLCLVVMPDRRPPPRVQTTINSSSSSIANSDRRLTPTAPPKRSLTTTALLNRKRDFVDKMRSFFM